MLFLISFTIFKLIVFTVVNEVTYSNCDEVGSTFDSGQWRLFKKGDNSVTIPFPADNCVTTCGNMIFNTFQVLGLFTQDMVLERKFVLPEGHFAVSGVIFLVKIDNWRMNHSFYISVDQVLIQQYNWKNIILPQDGNYCGENGIEDSQSDHPQSVGFWHPNRTTNVANVTVWHGLTESDELWGVRSFSFFYEMCHPTCRTCTEITFRNCTSCFSGKYLVLNSCVGCFSNCATCSGPSAFECTSCISGRYLKFNPGLCFPCSVECKQCSNGASNNCLECFPGFYLELNSKTCNPCSTLCKTCSGPTAGDCLSCASNQALVKGHCLSCEVVCKTCIKTPSFCLTCAIDEGSIVSQFFIHRDVGVCQVSCRYGYFEKAVFLQTDQLECLPCTAGCRVCKGASQADCLDCVDVTLFLNKKDLSCRSKCPSGTFGNSYYMICQLCDKSCLECSGPSIYDCVICKTSFYLHQGTCLNQCPKGMVASGFQNQCHKTCLDICEQCLDGSNDLCAVCKLTQYLLQNQCVEDCGDGQYKSTALGTRTCEPCQYPCLSCRSADFCLKCASPYSLVGNGCVCLSSYRVLDGECTPCMKYVGFQISKLGKCEQICGDGLRPTKSFHQCDDGNLIPFDGCSPFCTIEPFWTCTGGNDKEKDMCTNAFQSTFSGLDRSVNREGVVLLLTFSKEVIYKGELKNGFSVYKKSNDGQDQKTPIGFSVLPFEKQNYIFSMQIFETQNMRNQTIYIEVKDTITDTNNNSISNTVIKIEGINYDYYPDEVKLSSSLFEIYTFGLITVFFFNSIIFMIVQRFQLVLIALDQFQVLTSIAFANVKYPIHVRNVFRPMIILHLYQTLNIFDFGVFPSDFYSEPPAKFAEFGIQSLFLQNFGFSLSLILIFFILYATVKLGYLLVQIRPGGQRSIFFNLIFKFEWGYWINLSHVIYYPVVQSVFLQFTNSSSNRPQITISNLALSIVFFFLCLLYPLILIYKFVQQFRKRFQNEETVERYGQYWVGLDTSTFGVSLFYNYMILRKIYFAASTALMHNTPLLQVFVHCGGNFVFAGMFLWLRPFQNNDLQIYRGFLFELFLLAMRAGIQYFEFDYETDYNQWVLNGWYIAITIMVFFSLQTLITAIYFYRLLAPFIREVIQKYKQNSNLQRRKLQKETKKKTIINEQNQQIEVEDLDNQNQDDDDGYEGDAGGQLQRKQTQLKSSAFRRTATKQKSTFKTIEDDQDEDQDERERQNIFQNLDRKN